MVDDKLTPKESLRAYCTLCLSLKRNESREIKNCQGNLYPRGPCPFYPYRLGKRPSVRVFREFCLQCMNGYRAYVLECTNEKCPCWPYRMGTNPSLAGRGISESTKRGLDAFLKSRERGAGEPV